MSLRRKPNPNRNHPLFCPYCAGETLFPDEQSEFAWLCADCTRIFEVKYHGQDDPTQRPAPARSTAEALRNSLARHGHTLPGTTIDEHRIDEHKEVPTP